MVFQKRDRLRISFLMLLMTFMIYWPSTFYFMTFMTYCYFMTINDLLSSNHLYRYNDEGTLHASIQYASRPQISWDMFVRRISGHPGYCFFNSFFYFVAFLIYIILSCMYLTMLRYICHCGKTLLWYFLVKVNVKYFFSWLHRISCSSMTSYMLYYNLYHFLYRSWKKFSIHVAKVFNLGFCCSLHFPKMDLLCLVLLFPTLTLKYPLVGRYSFLRLYWLVF